MKRLYTTALLIVAALTLTTTSHAGTGKHLGKFRLEAKGEQGEGSLTKAQTIMEALKWRYDGLKDENAEYKPEYHLRAIQQADKLKSSTRSSASVTWEELGPGNVGGRTRAILIDKRDPTRQTVYVGSVGGGIFKSTNGGDSWTRLGSLTGTHNQSISCFAQDKNGVIYYGTGESFSFQGLTTGSSGNVGDGLWYLDASDVPQPVQNAQPSLTSVASLTDWSFVSRIAIDPKDENHIFVANNKGLVETTDLGATWTLIGSSTKPITGLGGGSTAYTQGGDVKMSSDGLNIYASVGTGSYPVPGGNLIRSLDGGATWEKAPLDLTGVSGVVRIEIASAFSNPDVFYFSMAWGVPGRNCTVFKTTSAGDNPIVQIGHTGGNFDPFGSNAQGFYDNVIAVNPFNEDKMVIGGTQFYSYSSKSGFRGITKYNGDPSDPQWVHPDCHAITFSDLDSNLMFVGCDGGIFKCTNASSGFPQSLNFRAKNRSYGVTQMYSVAAAPDGSVIGGAQDNGTNYCNYSQGGINNSKSVGGGDGFFAEISHFNPNVFIAGVYYNATKRSSNQGTSSVDLYDAVIDPLQRGEPTYCGGDPNNGSHDASFHSTYWLAETKTATNSAYQTKFKADHDYNIGDVVTVTSRIKQPFTVTATSPLTKDSTYTFPDQCKSRLYLSTNCGLFMTPDVLDFSAVPRWFRFGAGIGYTLSLSASVTGDTVYAGNANGGVTRITGINSRLQYDTAALGSINYQMPNSLLGTATVSSNRDVEGVSVDLNNANHVMCVISGFSNGGNAAHVFHSFNAGVTWTSATGDLPDMPVYDCVIDVYNPNRYIIGSELGVWVSEDQGVTWTEANAGKTAGNDLGRLPVYRLRQQNYLTDDCYALYIGTHGRGMWRSTDYTSANGCAVNPLGIHDPKTTAEVNDLMVYPNPISNSGKVKISLSKNADVTFRIIDMPGRLIREVSYRNVSAGGTDIDILPADLNNGTYLVAATLSTGATMSRLFVVAK